MIQRKQTLYLLASGILMLLTILLNIAKVTTSDMVYNMNAMGFEDMQGALTSPSWVLFGLTILIVLISFYSIFLYNKRVAQRRITVFNLFLKIGFYVLVWIYLSSFMKINPPSDPSILRTIKVIMGMPIIAMIFDALAARAIAIDEMTIRSINRLRR